MTKVHPIIWTLFFAAGMACVPRSGMDEKPVHLSVTPEIDPDYQGIVIPPNMAPLNFKIIEQGTRYFVRLSGKRGKTIEVASKTGSISFPMNSWKELLRENPGDTLRIDICVKGSTYWRQYRPLKNTVSSDSIDGTLTYRLINPAYHLWGEMGIYRRHIESFDEIPVLLNRAMDKSCMNCHHPSAQNPENTMLHVRAGRGSGTFILYNGRPMKVNTATDFNRAGSYASWHPDGNLLAFSVNDLMLFFHVLGESRDVVDLNSNLIIYNIPENQVTTCPGISDPDRMETFPCWAPDGRALYFASAPKIDRYFVMKDGREDLDYQAILYDINRISYDPASGTWGRVETVFSGRPIKKSAVMPRISPDGRYLLFTVCDYGSFPIYLKSADLMLMDLKTGETILPGINSHETESYHAWSSNSRWIVFSSKRRDGLLARPYFSHVGPDGQVSKPFVLPQKDPAFYDHFLKTYNVPEMARTPAKISPQEIIRTMNTQEAIKSVLDPAVRIETQEKTQNHENAPG